MFGQAALGGVGLGKAVRAVMQVANANEEMTDRIAGGTLHRHLGGCGPRDR
jgi:hypothetical protein